VFQVDRERRAKFEEGLAEGLLAYDAAIAAGYCSRYARKLASPDKEPTPEALIKLAWRQIHDKNCPERVRQRYWEKLGEHFGLWGSKAKPREPAEAVPPVIEEDEGKSGEPAESVSLKIEGEERGG